VEVNNNHEKSQLPAHLQPSPTCRQPAANVQRPTANRTANSRQPSLTGDITQNPPKKKITITMAAAARYS